VKTSVSNVPVEWSNQLSPRLKPGDACRAVISINVSIEVFSVTTGAKYFTDLGNLVQASDVSVISGKY